MAHAAGLLALLAEGVIRWAPVTALLVFSVLPCVACRGFGSSDFAGSSSRINSKSDLKLCTLMSLSGDVCGSASFFFLFRFRSAAGVEFSAPDWSALVCFILLRC